MRSPRALKGRVSNVVAAEEWYNPGSSLSTRLLRPAAQALTEETAMTEALIVTWRVERWELDEEVGLERRGQERGDKWTSLAYIPWARRIATGHGCE